MLDSTNNLAPICLFVYKRLDVTQQTIEALQKNFLASESDLFIFSDGAINENATEKINQVREYVKTITGFKSVTIFESETNKGLANSIISGVTQIIEQHGKVIVVEDDLITSRNFLDFMNQALIYYHEKETIFSVSGFGHKLVLPKNYNYDIYLRGRPSSWGWATWQNRWTTVDWKVSDWEIFRHNTKMIKAFKAQGSDMFKMLENSMSNVNNSWAIRFAYNQFKQNKLTISPVESKVRNIGFGDTATHCKTQYNRHKINFDLSEKRNFIWKDDLFLESAINKQLIANNSFSSRIKSKLINLFIR
jgi:hypothetical protein